MFLNSRNIYSSVSFCELLFFPVKFQIPTSSLIQYDIYYSFCLMVFGVSHLCRFSTHMKLHLIFPVDLSHANLTESSYKNLERWRKFFQPNNWTIIHQIETIRYLGVMLYSALSHQHTNSHRVLSILLALKKTLQSILPFPFLLALC